MEIMQEIGRLLYKIEVKPPKTESLDPLFQIARKKGGSVIEDEVNPGFPTSSVRVNSRDPEFVELCVKLGLGEELLKKAKEAYGI